MTQSQRSPAPCRPLTVREVARRLDLTLGAVTHHIRVGNLPARWDGRRYLVEISSAELAAFGREHVRRGRVAGLDQGGLLGTAEAAARLGRSLTQVCRAIRAGLLPARSTARGYRIAPADLAAFAAQRCLPLREPPTVPDVSMTMRPGRHGEALTRQHIEVVDELVREGRSNAEIAAALGCTEAKLKHGCVDHGYSLRAVRASLTPAAVAQQLGVFPSAVRGWIANGWLEARQVGGRRRTLYVVPERCLLRFLEDERYWPFWEPSRLRDLALREWAQELRAAWRDPLLTAAQVAERLHVEAHTVNNWARTGRLAALAVRDHRHHHYLVRASTLATFRPPCEEPRRPRVRRRPWTAEEDRRLRLLRQRGFGIEAIARLLDRAPSSVALRLRRLGAHAAGYPAQVGAAQRGTNRRIRRGVRLDRAAREQMIALALSGEPIDAVAERFGVTRQAVYYHLGRRRRSAEQETAA